MRFLKVFDRKVSGKHDLIERISKYLIVIYLKKMKKNYLKNIEVTYDCLQNFLFCRENISRNTEKFFKNDLLSGYYKIFN